MPMSQNGWRAGTPEEVGGLDKSTVDGVAFPQGVRRGDVATVLHYVAHQFHVTVEHLVSGWCWGYHYKEIEGSDELSNHASGTALDLNAPRHPMGRRGTFSGAQVAGIRRILDYCDGVIRWGGDYTGRADDMHFEIVKGADSVAKLAAKINGTPAPAPRPPAGRPAPRPEVAFPLPRGYYFGPDNGEDASVSGVYGRHFKGHTDRYWLQTWTNQLRRRGWPIGKGRRWLADAGNDGRFGAEYDALVRAWQRDQGLAVDGRLGARSWTAAYKNPVR